MERSSKADCWGPARDAETGKGSRQLLAVDGLFCGGCARGLEQRLRKLEGVLDAGVHYLTASAFVHWNPRLCSLREIEACIASAGYRMVERFHLPVVLARLSAATEVLTYRLAIGVFFAMWSMGAAFVLYFGSGVPRSAAWWLALASGACLVPVIVAGRAILAMGWRSPFVLTEKSILDDENMPFHVAEDLRLTYRYLDLRRGPWRDPDFRPAAHARQLQCIFRRSGDAYRAAPDRTVDRDPRAGRLDSGPYRTGICGTGNGLARIRRSRGLDFRAGPGRQGAGACRRASNYRWTNCCGPQPPEYRVSDRGIRTSARRGRRFGRGRLPQSRSPARP